MKAGRKPLLNSEQKQLILKSTLNVKTLADTFNVGKDTIYRTFKNRNKK